MVNKSPLYIYFSLYTGSEKPSFEVKLPVFDPPPQLPSRAMGRKFSGRFLTFLIIPSHIEPIKHSISEKCRS